MAISRPRFILPLLCILVTLLAGCGRTASHKKGTAHSYQLVLDTRRAPVEQLSGCFIPAVFPAWTRIPIVFVQKIPEGAVFTKATIEIQLKNGEMKILEPVIEKNQVYLKFAVPALESYSQYNLLVWAEYEY